MSESFGLNEAAHGVARAEARVTDLDGVRVLIVEDEAIVCMLIEQLVEDFGCEVSATAARVPIGAELARDADIDLAVLDMNLAGQPIDPVVEVLIERGVPFVFATGYGEGGLSPAWRGRPVVTKPFMPAQLRAAMLRALEGGPGLA
jgi:CheY-like chemotaxis protein